jgi:hypothetical protein
MEKLPETRSKSRDIDAFIERSRSAVAVNRTDPRLLFAIDATASRQPTWDTAATLQHRMFAAVASAGTLSLQLCFYRGFNELKASPWIGDTASLSRLMRSVRCEGGHTQIARLLRHAVREHREHAIRALVFIGDAVEEAPDDLCALAGECGLLGLPLFVFQEGHQPGVEATFRSMAKLSRGAYARFNSASAERLAELLSAVARYAVGGRLALASAGDAGAQMLLTQLP